ncbi:hypothetical protein [Thermococcus argininiproducens]|nr:hypothetical protein [Thermococcus argininiproducens]
MKEATADIDIVVENIPVLKALDEVLTNTPPELKVGPGVRVIYMKEIEHEYKVKLGAFSVYKKLDPELGDFTLDVFVKRVLRGITLSDGMKVRSIIPDEFMNLKVLRVQLVSLEDIFLFKGVTSLSRIKDIDDLLRLLEHGIDFSIILDELNSQKVLIEPERFEWLIGLLYEKSLMLKDILVERGLKSRGLDKLIKSLEISLQSE